MHVAIIGTRGIPGRYGGFETLATELSGRLAAKGHDVTVYCRRSRTDETQQVPRGVRRRFLPYLRGKYLETVTHTALSVVDTLAHPCDVVLLVNGANAIFAWIPRLRGTPVALNVDGIERQRAKWGTLGRIWYALGERLALLFPNVIIADARVIHDYYRRRYGRDSVIIAYGAQLSDSDVIPDLEPHRVEGLQPDGYFLYVSRLEPENQADLVIRAYRSVPGTLPLLIVGDAPYAPEFRESLRALAAQDPRVRLPGGIYGSAYQDLQRGALAYVQATSVGGSHPALIEAMGVGNLVLAYGTPENAEVLDGAGLLFKSQRELSDAMATIVAEPHAPRFEALRRSARERARASYDWESVTERYVELFTHLTAGRQGKPSARPGTHE